MKNKCYNLHMEIEDGFDEVMRRVARVASRPGDAYLVGGSVRDLLLGRPSADIDIVVTGNPAKVASEIAGPLGGTAFVMDSGRDVHRVSVNERGMQVDISPLKGTIEDDLSGRDFTINAMACSVAGLNGISTASLIDPYGGEDDLDAGVIRALGEDAFMADPLRMLRAFRLSWELGFAVEPDTLSYIKKHAGLVGRVSAERIRDELYIMLSGNSSAGVFRDMHDAGLLGEIIPETVAMAGLIQGEPHVHDLLEHSIKAMEYAERVMEEPDRYFGDNAGYVEKFLGERPDGVVMMRGLVKLSAFLHDIGKPGTMKYEQDRVRFIGHDAEGADINAGIASRMKMSGRASEVLSRTAALHMRPLHLTKDRHTKRAVYRLVRDAEGVLPVVLIVAVSDAMATRDRPDALATDVEGLVASVAGYYYGEYMASKSEPLVRGEELMETLSIGPGPVVGMLLNDIEEARAEGAVTDKEDALLYARERLRVYHAGRTGQ